MAVSKSGCVSFKSLAAGMRGTVHMRRGAVKRRPGAPRKLAGSPLRRCLGGGTLSSREMRHNRGGRGGAAFEYHWQWESHMPVANLSIIARGCLCAVIVAAAACSPRRVPPMTVTDLMEDRVTLDGVLMKCNQNLSKARTDFGLPQRPDCHRAPRQPDGSGRGSEARRGFRAQPRAASAGPRQAAPGTGGENQGRCLSSASGARRTGARAGPRAGTAPKRRLRGAPHPSSFGILILGRVRWG